MAIIEDVPTEPPPSPAIELNPDAPEFIPYQHPFDLLPECIDSVLTGAWAAAEPSEVPTLQPWKLSDVTICASEEEEPGSRLLLVPRAAPEDALRRLVASTVNRRKSSGYAPAPLDPMPAATTAAPTAGTVDTRTASRRSTNAAEALPAQVATLVIKNLAPDLEKAELESHLEERQAAAAEVELRLDTGGTFRGTAFARYASPGQARKALEKLGPSPDFGGRKARVELQKSRANFGRRCLEADLSQEDLAVVRVEIERFVRDPSRSEAELPASFSSDQRKYAHSLAERHGLLHATRQGEGREKTFVYLSKSRQHGGSFGRKKAHSVAVCEAGSRLDACAPDEGGKSLRRATDPSWLSSDQAAGLSSSLAVDPNAEA